MNKQKGKLTKKQQKKFQEAIRTDPQIRKKAAEQLSIHIKKVLEYIVQEASSQSFDCHERIELALYIDKVSKGLEEQTLLMLDLAGGDDIVIGRKNKKPERWDLLDLEKR